MYTGSHLGRKIGSINLMSPRTSGTSPRMRRAPINKCRASATAMTSNGLRQTQTARSSSWALYILYLVRSQIAFFSVSNEHKSKALRCRIASISSLSNAAVGVQRRRKFASYGLSRYSRVVELTPDSLPSQ